MRWDDILGQKIRTILQSAVLRDYPNPERKGCPGASVIERLASSDSPSKEEVWEHVVHCSPCYREFLDYHQVLRARARASRRTRLFLMIAVLGCIGAGSAAVIMALQNHSARSQIRTLRAELQSRASATVQPGRIGNEPPIPVLPQVTILTPGGFTRSAQNRKQGQRIMVPTTAAPVFLLLYMGRDDNSRYDVVLNDEAGQELQRFNGLRPLSTGDDVKIIPVSIPSRLLKKGDYTISVLNGDSNAELTPLNVFQFSIG